MPQSSFPSHEPANCPHKVKTVTVKKTKTKKISLSLRIFGPKHDIKTSPHTYTHTQKWMAE